MSDPWGRLCRGGIMIRPGFLTIDLMRQTLPHGPHAFWICGPEPMVTTLPGWDVATDGHRHPCGKGARGGKCR